MINQLYKICFSPNTESKKYKKWMEMKIYEIAEALGFEKTVIENMGNMVLTNMISFFGI